MDVYKLIWTWIFITAGCCTLAAAVAINNGVNGIPDVECMEDRIRFWVHTKNYFAGRIYAKNRAENRACIRAGFSDLQTTKPHYDVAFGLCGMQSLRSLDPRGMYYGITVVVSFHPLFITKVDQAFHVKCFFEEANRGLTAELGVSMIPTTEVGAHHSIPGCTYSIHAGSINQVENGFLSAPIKFGRVGDKILHRWACHDAMFGILVNNCYVTDGFGQRAEVVDATGCPLDPILITGIRYAANLTVAFAESHVFKFADKPGVWFFCQIQMCMRGAGMCNGLTPPQCAAPLPGYGGSFPVQTPSPSYKHGQRPPSYRTDFVERPAVTQPYGNGARSETENEVTLVYEAQAPYVYEQDDMAGVAMQKNSVTNELDTDFSERGHSLDPTVTPTYGLKSDRAAVIDSQPLLDKEDLRFLSNGVKREKNSQYLGTFESVFEGDFRRNFKDSPKKEALIALPENATQEISGQLIIYDLDEDPMYLQVSKSIEKDRPLPAAVPSDHYDSHINSTRSSARYKRQCVISPQSFLIIITGLGGLAVILSTSLCALFVRMRCMRKDEQAVNGYQETGAHSHLHHLRSAAELGHLEQQKKRRRSPHQHRSSAERYRRSHSHDSCKQHGHHSSTSSSHQLGTDSTRLA